MFYVGVDPDTHNCAYAIVDSVKVVAVGVIRQKHRKERQATLAMCAAVAEHLRARADGGMWPLPAEVLGFAVEGQELYLKGPTRTKDPRDILFLAPVAGAMIQALTFMHPEAVQMFPSPGKWKGSLAKKVHQVHVCKRAGWRCRLSSNGKDAYCVPEPVPDVPGAKDLGQSDWKHVLDAVGLAQWARDQYERLMVKKETGYVTTKQRGIRRPSKKDAIKPAPANARKRPAPGADADRGPSHGEVVEPTDGTDGNAGGW